VSDLYNTTNLSDVPGNVFSLDNPLGDDPEAKLLFEENLKIFGQSGFHECSMK
jgi:hypothetical protein